MKRNGKMAIGLLCAAAMAALMGMTAFADEETKTLRVAMECGYAPYN